MYKPTYKHAATCKCEKCSSDKLHQTKRELARMLDQLAYYNEYKNKLKKEEDNE